MFGTKLLTLDILQDLDVVETETFEGFSHETFTEVLAFAALELDVLRFADGQLVIGEGELGLAGSDSIHDDVHGFSDGVLFRGCAWEKDFGEGDLPLFDETLAFPLFEVVGVDSGLDFIKSCSLLLSLLEALHGYSCCTGCSHFILDFAPNLLEFSLGGALFSSVA